MLVLSKHHFIILLFSLLITHNVAAQQQYIFTYAGCKGISSFCPLGDGGLAIHAKIDHPFGITVDDIGNLYICDGWNDRIRRVDTFGIITTIAGNGTYGYSGDDGPATDAQLHQSYDIAVDRKGNIYLADAVNNRIRMVDTTGIIKTIVGTGSSTGSYSGDGGPATNANLNIPYNVAIDPVGNIYISDRWNFRIRKVDTNGIINTIAGTGIVGSSGDGGKADTTKIFPTAIKVDRIGNIFFVDSVFRIRKIDTAGIISTIAGSDTIGYTGDGGLATNAKICAMAIYLDDTGSIYFADQTYRHVRKIDTNGIISTVAGSGIAGNSGDGYDPLLARMLAPDGVTVNKRGEIFVADQGYGIRIITTDSIGYNSVSNTKYKQLNYNISPNPVNNTLTITATDIVYSVTITNFIGQVINNNKYNSEKVQIDVTDLTKGMYIIRINDTEIRKFIKE